MLNATGLAEQLQQQFQPQPGPMLDLTDPQYADAINQAFVQYLQAGGFPGAIAPWVSGATLPATQQSAQGTVAALGTGPAPSTPMASGPLASSGLAGGVDPNLAAARAVAAVS